jgi:phosphoglycolate phosphatase-like HAD superfamily hydrolase
MPMRLVLFDIDGTLVRGGAGGRALRSALLQIYALPAGNDGVRYDGKTDPRIVREILSYHGQEDQFTDERVSSLFTLYLSCLREELTEARDFRVLSGAHELVRTLDRKENFLLGLATGNIEEGARLKLERGGLESFFSFGGFGSDAEDRTDLIRIAIERACQKNGRTHPEKSFVVGDTPQDIVHGKEAGASTLAVASGNYSVEDLKSYKPDAAVESLQPIEPVMDFLSS